MVSCSRESGLTLNDQTDSLSYVVGMNIAYNIMKMDSTLRPEVVCAAIDDALSGREMLSAEDAKTYFLAYMNYGAYERTRAYEEQYLSDLEKSDRDIVRTRSGLTYKVEELGDMNRAVTSNRDTVAIRYTIESIDGGQIYSSYERGDTLRAAVNRLTDGRGCAARGRGRQTYHVDTFGVGLRRHGQRGAGCEAQPDVAIRSGGGRGQTPPIEVRAAGDGLRYGGLVLKR